MLEFETTQLEDVSLVEVKGRVDSANATQLGDFLTTEIDEGKTRLVLDLSLLIYMSSAGLRELVNAYRKLERIGGDLLLANPSPRVRDVLELSGLNTVLKVFETRAEAVHST